MSKLNKLALGVVLAAGTSIAAAGTISGGTARSVGAEMSTKNGFDDVAITAGSISIALANGTRASDELTITLSGAEFAGGYGDFTLYQSAAVPADNDDWVLFSATSNVLTFFASGIIPQAADNIYLLSSSTAGAFDDVVVDLPPGSAGATVTLSADHTGDDTFAAAATLFTYTNEFSAEVSGAFDGVIDAVAAGRLAFDPAGSDALGLDFDLAAASQTNALNDNDSVTITLAGDMSGIGSVIVVDAAGREFEGVISSSSATVTASGASLFAGAAEPQLEITPNGSVVMSPRDFTVSATLNLRDEAATKTLYTSEDAGELTINGASGRIAQLSLNYGFVQWIKVTNLGLIPAAIEVDITANGTTYEGLPILDGAGSPVSVAANSVATVSGAQLEAALEAAGGTTDGVDVSVLVSVPVAPALVKFHTEKKDNTGRTISIVE